MERGKDRGAQGRCTESGTLYVGFFSALDYWRGVSNLGDYRDSVEPQTSGSKGIEHHRILYAETHRISCPLHRVRDIKDLGVSLSCQAPLDILISSPKERPKAQKLKPHLVSCNLPKHTFVHARRGVLVTSPEATFVQLAQYLTLPQLLLVGMELCGTYSLDGSEVDGTGFSQRPRLITAERLIQYISWCHKQDGLELAGRAARLLLNDSGSPGESDTILALTLPNHLRGLGLPKPKLNKRALVTIQNKDGTSQSQYYYDFYWTASRRVGPTGAVRKRKVDGEYDSDAHHAGTLQMYEDARRGNSVQYMGTAHVVITNYDMQSAKALMVVARQLSRCIWHRLPDRESLTALESDLDNLLDELRHGKSYPVSLDSRGRMPIARRSQQNTPRHGARG